MLAAEYAMLRVRRIRPGYGSKVVLLLAATSCWASLLRGQVDKPVDQLKLAGYPTAEQSETFAKTRAKVLALPHTLPNIVCNQSTDRFEASYNDAVRRSSGTPMTETPSHALYGLPSSADRTRRQSDSTEYGDRGSIAANMQPPQDLKWRYADTIGAEVAYVDGKDSYSAITLNGRPTGGKKMESFLGLMSAGEFGSDLVNLLSAKQAQATEFSFRGKGSLLERPVLIFDFRVQKNDNTTWYWYTRTVRLFFKGPKIETWPGYAGSLWIDSEKQEVLRLEIKAVEIDPKFPLKTMEQTIDYGHVQAGDLSDLLVPLHSETITCDRFTALCNRNVLEFKDWRKFVVKARVLAPTQ